MTSDAQNLIIAAVINDVEEMQDPIVDAAQSHKPRLLIENYDPDRTVSALSTTSATLGGVPTSVLGVSTIGFFPSPLVADE